ncbi:MAG: tetratricopeptide repeat protein [Pseudomonadota bacterium]
MRQRTAILTSVLVLAGCAGTPVVPRVEVDTRAAVAAVRAAGVASADELAVRPLVDPGVADLQAQAAAHEAAGRLDAAAQALDQALEIAADDPALLQARAEVALAQGRFDEALALAERSHASGPKVGPLCRRQQEARRQVALAQARLGDAGAATRAEAARREREACTVTPPPRY